MAWFSGKVSLGNFPDLAGAVNKLSESVKNIEKNFDTALGFEDEPDSSTSTEASGLWPVMSFMGQKSEDNTVESSEKTVSPQKSSTVEEKESQNSDTEQTTALEENQMLERKKDGEHLEIAEKKDGVISDSGKAELESKLQSEPKAVEPPEPDVNDVKIPDSADELQGRQISEVGPAENSDTLEIKSEAPRVDEVEAASILHNESHNVFHDGSIDEQETQAEETVEQSSIQAEASSDTQAEASDDVLAEASSDNQAEASSDTQAEAAVDSSSSQPIISAGVSDMACELSLSTASPSGEASEMVSGSVSKVDDGNDQTVGGDEGVNYGKVGSKEQHLSSGLNISDSIDSMLELEKVKTEIKMMETALQGAARQAQAKADEIAKLMNENEHLKAVIGELKRKSNDAEIESLREEYHQRVSTLERKVYALTKERDTLRREQNKKSDAAALLKEKDEIINQVMAEGEELSKKQATQESTIRKLRAQIRELEEEKKGLMTKVQVEENKVESIKKDKTTTENLLQETIEKHQAELSAQKEYYTDALSASKKAEALAEARADNEARTELESHLREAEERESMLVQALEELRQTLSRKEQEAVFREDMLCKDIEDLQKYYQASERRCEELITQVPDSTRPLLRQIEAMQVDL